MEAISALDMMSSKQKFAKLKGEIRRLTKPEQDIQKLWMTLKGIKAKLNKQDHTN